MGWGGYYEDRPGGGEGGELIALCGCIVVSILGRADSKVSLRLCCFVAGSGIPRTKVFRSFSVGGSKVRVSLFLKPCRVCEGHKV